MTPTTLAGATTVAATQHKTKRKHSNFIFGKKLILFKIMTTDSQVISVSCGSLQGLLHTSKFGPGCRSICIEFKGNFTVRLRTSRKYASTQFMTLQFLSTLLRCNDVTTR